MQQQCVVRDTPDYEDHPSIPPRTMQSVVLEQGTVLGTSPPSVPSEVIVEFNPKKTSAPRQHGKQSRSVSTDIVLSIRNSLNDSEKRLVRRMGKMEDSVQELHAIVGSVLAAVNEGNHSNQTLSNKVSHLSAVFGTGAKSNGTRRRSGSTVDVKKEVDEKYALIDEEIRAVFEVDTASSVLNSVLSKYVSTVCKGIEGITLWKMCFSVVMFGNDRSMSKDVYMIGIPKAWTEFRNMFAKEAIQYGLEHYSPVSRTKLEMSSSKYLHTTAASNCICVEPSSGRFSNSNDDSAGSSIPRPGWLRKRIVSKAALKLAKATSEKTKSELSKRKKDPAELEGAHICSLILISITSFLRESRIKVKTCFFEDVGVLFDSWENAKWLSRTTAISPQSLVFSYNQTGDYDSSVPKTISGVISDVCRGNKVLL